MNWCTFIMQCYDVPYYCDFSMYFYELNSLFVENYFVESKITFVKGILLCYAYSSLLFIWFIYKFGVNYSNCGS